MFISKLYHPLWKPLIQSPASPDKFQTLYPVVNPNTKIGIEIEAENYQGFDMKEAELNRIWNVWMNKVEPSLRNNGIEFISGAISGPQIGEALHLLEKMNLSGNLSYTELAGLHIHLNVRDFTVEQFANLVMLYIVYEDSLYRISGNRKDSIYCVPARSCVSGLPRLVRSQDDMLESIRHANKYMGFNYAVVKSYGSIEFRHSAGTNNIQYILHWINTLLRLYDAAKTANFAQLKETIFQLNTNSEYVNFTKNVFKSESDWILSPKLDKEMSEGISILKEWSIDSHMKVSKILDDPMPKPRTPKPRTKVRPPYGAEIKVDDFRILDDIANLAVFDNNMIHRDRG